MFCVVRSEAAEVTVGFRTGGEVINVPNRGRHTLKNLMQEWGVPPWQRDRIPLVYLGEKLVSVVGYVTDADYVGLRIDLSPPERG